MPPHQSNPRPSIPKVESCQGKFIDAKHDTNTMIFAKTVELLWSIQDYGMIMQVVRCMCVVLQEKANASCNPASGRTYVEVSERGV
jgi:hypothetical protein